MLLRPASEGRVAAVSAGLCHDTSSSNTMISSIYSHLVRSDQRQFLACFLKRVGCSVEIFLVMCACHDRPDSRLVFAHHRIYYRKNEYSKFEHLVGQFVGLPALTNHDWSDGSLALSRVEAQVLECFLEVASIVPEFLHQRRILLHQLDRGDAGARNTRRLGPREEIASDLILEIGAQVFRANNIATYTAEGFGEGSHVNIDLSFEVEVVRDSPSILAKDSIAMSIVNVRYGLILRCQVDDVFEGRDVSIHAEDSVGNDQDSAETISIL